MPYSRQSRAGASVPLSISTEIEQQSRDLRADPVDDVSSHHARVAGILYTRGSTTLDHETALFTEILEPPATSAVDVDTASLAMEVQVNDQLAPAGALEMFDFGLS